MNTFNVLIGFLGGANGDLADTEGEEHAEDEIPSPQREIIASIDNEMALAREMLNKLTMRRNEVHRELFLKTAPSPEEQKILLDDIAAKEAELMRLQLEVAETHNKLSKLPTGKDGALPSSAEVSDDAQQRGYFLALEDRQTLLYQAGLYQERLERLIQRQKAVRNDLEGLRRTLSPIRKLPPEILSVIFTETLQHKDFTCPSSNTAPLLLANICSSWRKIALHTPELWSSISIKEVDNQLSPQPALIECWIQRSGAYPLSFKAEEERHFSSTVSPLSQILDIYIPHYIRWRNVHLMYGSTFSLKTGFEVLPQDAVFPMLESLYLERGYWRQKEIEPIARMLRSAPRLRSVSWISESFYTHLSSVPWAQLSQLAIGHPISIGHVLRILSDCPSLRDIELSLTPDPQSFDDSSSESVIVHHSLQHLKAHVLEDTKPLFNRLQLPQLKHLSLAMLKWIHPEFVPQELHWPDEALISFLTRSGCSLDFFSLDDFDISPEDLIGCLRHSSMTLKELHLNNERNRKGYINDQVLKLMTYWPDLSDSTTTSDVEEENLKEAEPLCPYIHTLKLWGCISSTDGVLAQMLDSRCKGRRNHGLSGRLHIALIGLHADPQHPLDMQWYREISGKRGGITILNTL